MQRACRDVQSIFHTTIFMNVLLQPHAHHKLHSVKCTNVPVLHFIPIHFYICCSVVLGLGSYARMSDTVPDESPAAMTGCPGHIDKLVKG